MRVAKTVPLFFAGWGLATAFACGACGASKVPTDGAKGPDTAASAATDAGAATDDAGPATTTTATLDDAGAGTGQKLPQVDSGATASSSDAGRVQLDGGSDPGRGQKDIEAIVKAHRDEARKCYDDGLKSHPGIEGDLTIHWVIAPDGKIKTIELNTARSTITEPSVVSCIIDIIKKISFAPSPRGVESSYNYPFNFHPRGTR